MNEIKQIEKIIKSSEVINAAGPYLENVQAWVVGGFLRDIILEKKSCDIDLVVPKGFAKSTAQKIAKGLNAHFVPLDEINQIYRVVLEDKVTYLDIADLEGEEINKDLLRRDFTINSLGYDLKENKLLDMCGAVDDLKNGIISEISEKNIQDDPLRILRAYRFQSETGFKISKSLKNIITKHAKELEKSAKERINIELVKLFAGENCVESLLAMDEAGILQMLIPNVEQIKTIPSNSHHHLPLFLHLVETTNRIQEFYEKAPVEVKEHFDEPFCGPIKRIAYLKIAAFLHDIGKPSTWLIEHDTGRHRFIKHDDVGSKIVEKPLKNLKFSNKQIKYIQKLIKYHIYPANVVFGENFTDKAVMRFYRKMEDEVFDVIAIAYGDRLSAQGPAVTKEVVERNINGLLTLMNRYIETKNEIKPIEKLIDGNEIMELLSLKPGKELGVIMKALYEAQLSGDVVTKEQAQEFVKNEDRLRNSADFENNIK